jgi:hypothetical protein
MPLILEMPPCPACERGEPADASLTCGDKEVFVCTHCAIEYMMGSETAEQHMKIVQLMAKEV